MLPSARLPLGTPGAYALPDALATSLHPQRMDVCAFVGVAPRGPAYVPRVDEAWPPGWTMVTQPERPLRRSVPVMLRSFDDYLRVFGGFEGPGALPHAVASYFEQGGRIAWVVRIVHDRPGAVLGEGCASGLLAGAFPADLRLVARNEGSWGDRLTTTLGLRATAVAFTVGAGDQVEVNAGTPVLPGSLLRLTSPGGTATLAFCDGLAPLHDGLQPVTRWRPMLSAAPAQPPIAIDLIEAWLDVDDGAGRKERFEHLALSPEHPQYLASVLCDRSTLLWPHADWAGQRLAPVDARIEFVRGAAHGFTGGEDAYDTLVPGDFFDAAWSVADDEPGQGLAALAPLEAVASVGTAGITQVVVPDLYVPAQWADPPPVPALVTGSAGATFAPCVEAMVQPGASAVPPSALTGLILDPRQPADLDTIARLQADVVAYCEATQSQIALLDVPPGLSQARIEQWRARFDSSWSAAYHPWLLPARRRLDGQEGVQARLRPLPPSAVAAGIIARRERERGLQVGPANEVTRQVIHLAESQPEGRVDALMPLGLNCFVREAEGIVLVSARTLSRERDWRQLSVRRLMLMLRRTLLVETQWAVFEPNGPVLWADLRHAIESLLRGLFQAGAFAGRTEAESFFVRVQTEPWRLDRGELLVEVGVAPAEPLEFILVRLRRDGDGTLNLED